MADTARSAGSSGGAYLDSDIGASQFAPVGVAFGKIGFVSITPTLPVAGAYSSGDYVGPSTTPVSAAGFTRASAGSAKIAQVTILDKAAQSLALEIWLFNATVVVPLDNAAWTVSDPDALKCIGVIPVAIADYKISGANSIATVILTSPLMIQPATGTTLFMALVARGTPTYATGDLVLTFGIDQAY